MRVDVVEPGVRYDVAAGPHHVEPSCLLDVDWRGDLLYTQCTSLHADPPPASPEAIERLGERGARVSAMEGRILGEWHRADEAGKLPPWVASRPRSGYLPCGCFLDRDNGTSMTPGTGEAQALTACRDHVFLVEVANLWEDRARELESKLGWKESGVAEDG